MKGKTKTTGRTKGLKINSFNTQLLDELIRFQNAHPPARLSKNLRIMLLEFLQTEGAIESMYLDDLLYDLQGLFDLLDILQSEEIKV